VQYADFDWDRFGSFATRIKDLTVAVQRKRSSAPSRDQCRDRRKGMAATPQLADAGWQVLLDDGIARNELNRRSAPIATV
jgi:hypothetical protein